MKKKVVFVISSLKLGGAEKSLITLLDEFNYDEFDVDVILFNKSGELLNDINKNVNIIIKSKNIENYFKPIKNIIMSTNKKKYTILFKRILNGITLRILKNRKAAEEIIWKNISNIIEEDLFKYDVAIAYCQGLPTYYVAEKINAKKKIAWMHTNYSKTLYDEEYDINFYTKYNKIITVSKDAKIDFQNTFKSLHDNCDVIYNIIDEKRIMELSKVHNVDFDRGKCQIILSIGRLHYSKGFDIMIPVIKKLVDDKINIKWYIIGEGPERKNLERLIKKFKLEGVCILLGAKKNPYPYLKMCDIYVQPSRIEGYCITLAEAKLFNKPILTTNFTGAAEQIVNGVTGTICNQGIEEIYINLKELLNNKTIQNRYSSNLKISDIRCKNDIQKLYAIIGRE